MMRIKSVKSTRRKELRGKLGRFDAGRYGLKVSPHFCFFTRFDVMSSA